jgi:hypothetical protein
VSKTSLSRYTVTPPPYCPDCIAPGYLMVYEEAPFESNGALWIECASCMAEKTTSQRLLMQDPYYAASLSSFDEFLVERIEERLPASDGPEVYYKVKWQHYPPMFSAYKTKAELLILTPTAARALRAFEADIFTREKTAEKATARQRSLFQAPILQQGPSVLPVSGAYPAIRPVTAARFRGLSFRKTRQCCPFQGPYLN